MLSLLVLVKGVYEYAKAQKWKKAEFVAKEVKEFYNDFNVKRALVLLDWNANELELRSNEIEDKSKIWFNDEILMSALQTHKERNKFKDEEVLIKGIFDSFLDKLSMFNNYVEAGLIDIADIKTYFAYWINIIGDKNNDRKPEKVRTQIWVYINEYGYSDIIELCYKFGYDIKK